MLLHDKGSDAARELQGDASEMHMKCSTEAELLKARSQSPTGNQATDVGFENLQVFKGCSG